MNDKPTPTPTEADIACATAVARLMFDNSEEVGYECMVCANETIARHVAASVDLATAELRDTIDRLRHAVNSSCDCGGRGPEDPQCCPACKVWHKMGGEKGQKSGASSDSEIVDWIALHFEEIHREYCDGFQWFTGLPLADRESVDKSFDTMREAVADAIAREKGQK